MVDLRPLFGGVCLCLRRFVQRGRAYNKGCVRIYLRFIIRSLYYYLLVLCERRWQIRVQQTIECEKHVSKDPAL